MRHLYITGFYDMVDIDTLDIRKKGAFEIRATTWESAEEIAKKLNPALFIIGKLVSEQRANEKER